MNQNNQKINIISIGATGTGMSGGDRIFIEFARYWSKTNNVEIFTSLSGKRMCEVSDLPKRVEIHLFKFGFIEYLHKIIYGIYLGLTLKIDKDSIVYSASEFWMDSLPAFILRLRFPKIKWVASWYQTAPNPIVGFSGGRHRFSALLYWMAQMPIRPLISWKANFALVNNELEKKVFPDKAIVVLGAVDTQKIKNFKLKIKNLPKVYDAVFQGRFHPQKGVVELIKIWRLVVNKIPSAKLAMVGDGPLMSDVKLKIKNLKLEDNVRLLGYIFDGDEKYKLFAQSKIVVHPALFDSGGMASAEAMAFGLPCVGFDLPAYVDYYPAGMLKSKFNNLTDFSENILRLLVDKKQYSKISKQAEKLVFTTMSWDNRAGEVLNKII
ncbi:glycosyltransferase family 4 protein [Candidatus Amesbacteria bacterium]|nr:glycosyltransferase family 4 protein [Candidatus Amesbacteria bacterium]